MVGYAHMGGGFLLMKLFCLSFFLGIILFVVWAVRNLNKKQMKKLFISLLVVGFLGMALSSLLVGKMGSWDKFKFKNCGETEDEVEEVE
jgi:hypothetical protein